MNDINPETSASISRSPPGVIGRVYESQSLALRHGIAFYEGWMDVWGELCNFGAHRIGENIRAQHDFLCCANPVKLQAAQIHHVCRAVEDYYREAGRVAQLLRAMPDVAAVIDE